MKNLRKLDVAIAEALGKELVWIEIIKGYNVLKYSTDGNDMLELLNELKEKLSFWQRRKFVVYLQQYASENLEFTIAASELIFFITPEIVSRAAYKALTGEEWEDK